MPEATVGGRENPEYIQALEYAQRRARLEGFDRALSEYGVNAVVAVTTGPAEKIVPEGSQEAGHTISARPKGAQACLPQHECGIGRVSGPHSSHGTCGRTTCWSVLRRTGMVRADAVVSWLRV